MQTNHPNHDEEQTLWFKPPPPVYITIERGETSQQRFCFVDHFKVGRDPSCQVQLSGTGVSRFHLEVFYDGKQWQVSDLKSANGTYLDGERIQQIPLENPIVVEVGQEGPLIRLSLQSEEAPKKQAVRGKSHEAVSMTQVMEHYFTEGSEEAGDHTLAVRSVFQYVKKKQQRRYGVLIGIILLAFLSASGVVFYQQVQFKKMRGTAEKIFYAMKTIELQLSQIETVALETAKPEERAKIEVKRVELAKMRKDYDQFIGDAGFYKKDMSEEDRMIFKMARLFGECEISMPDDFVKEVKHYVKQWKKTDALQKAILLAEQADYGYQIRQEMLAYHLPPHFFYLALKESGFRRDVVGPQTRFGIAKGIWQFIPGTATQYGLRTGPLVEMRQYDPRDERYSFDKATAAAARYLRDIYNTEAQASGLLVMASYNWGENRVRALLRKMPANPQERNFWKLLKKHKIPKETYDYVLYIFSAAVIGENPAHFGFEFENPLKGAEQL
jgi:pSer/pThr/pTyr-binding forkhead associated (FHA) protein